MKTLCVLLLCLAALTGRAAALDPDDGGLVDCGSEKVAVFAGTVSPDGHYAFGWTLRPARNKTPVNWTGYDPEYLFGWLQAYLPPNEDPDPEYQLVNGVVDLRAHRFTLLNSRDPYRPHKNHADMGVAWSHGSQSGKFAVVNIDARFNTLDLWLIETSDTGFHVVDLLNPAEKSAQRFIRQHSSWNSLSVTFGDVSFKHGEAMIDFGGEVPKMEDGPFIEGTVHVALPAGTIIGVKEKGR